MTNNNKQWTEELFWTTRWVLHHWLGNWLA